MTDVDTGALQQVLRTALIEKAINELWQTASPGLRQKLADAVVEAAIKAVTDRNGFHNPINARVQDEVRLIVAGVVEERKAEIAAVAADDLRKLLVGRLTSMLDVKSDQVLAEALTIAAKRLHR